MTSEYTDEGLARLPDYEKWVEREVLIFLAGSVTEHIFLGRPKGDITKNDLEHAMSLAARCRSGDDLGKFFENMINRCFEMVATSLFRARVGALVLALLDRSQISAEEILDLCNQAVEAHLLHEAEPKLELKITNRR